VRKHVGSTQGTAPLVCRAEDQQAGPVGAPGQWPPGLCCRRPGGGAYRPRYQGKRPMSEVHDIGILRYCKHIGNDIGFFLVPISVYPDIFCNIGTISGPISVKNPISVLARNGYVPILYRYRYRYREKTRYRAHFLQYRVWQGTGMSRYCTDIGDDIANIGSDIGKNITISCLGDTISENAISGHTLISGRVLSRYRGRYRDIISRLVLNFLFREVFLQGTNTMIQMMMMTMI
jgi:hypothetical protein